MAVPSARSPRPKDPQNRRIRRTWWFLASSFFALGLLTVIRLGLGGAGTLDWAFALLVVVLGLAAVLNRRAVKDLEEGRRLEVESFARILRGLSRSVSPDAIVDAIVEELGVAADADHTVVVRLRADSLTLEATLVSTRSGVPSSTTILPLSDLEDPLDLDESIVPGVDPVGIPIRPQPRSIPVGDWLSARGRGRGLPRMGGPDRAAAAGGHRPADFEEWALPPSIFEDSAARNERPAAQARRGVEAETTPVQRGGIATSTQRAAPTAWQDRSVGTVAAPEAQFGTTPAGDVGARGLQGGHGPRDTPGAGGPHDAADAADTAADAEHLLDETGGRGRLALRGGPGRRGRAGVATDAPTRIAQRLAGRVSGIYGLRNTVAAPLVTPAGVVGAIVLSRRTAEPWRPASLRILAGAAEEASLSLARAYSHRAAEARASTDSLTGLPNRRYFEEFCGLLARRRRTNDAVGILMIDIDHFKRVNDRFGHPVGDQVLRAVAGAITSAVRDDDVPARYGGEEFAVLLRNPSLEVAREVGERVRSAVARLDLRVLGPDRVTVSVGVAVARSPDQPIPELIDQADHALYRAKRMGRDRVMAA